MDNQLGPLVSIEAVWHLEGQYINASGLISRLFDWTNAYKVTGFYSDYKAHKPQGVDSPMLSIQHIEGGVTEMSVYISKFGFLKNMIEIGEFSSQSIPVGRHNEYWLSLTDSNTVKLETAK